MPTNQELSEETIIQRNETKFLASALGAEIVMMNTDNGDYIGVNSVGSDVWNLLNEPIRIDDLVKKITELYDVTPEQGKTEIDEFLQRMVKHDMLIIKEPVV
ncbi:MAG: hypothetical protein JWR67_1649 [Mucilaginibacter sp.]|nr:hypothetical protein [Mucilaginibacter sp.]